MELKRKIHHTKRIEKELKALFDSHDIKLKKPVKVQVSDWTGEVRQDKGAYQQSDGTVFFYMRGGVYTTYLAMYLTCGEVHAVEGNENCVKDDYIRDFL